MKMVNHANEAQPSEEVFTSSLPSSRKRDSVSAVGEMRRSLSDPVITKSAAQTKKFGQGFAKNSRGRVLALEGELGSGKTTFLQGFARGLGVKEKILSPTFILIKKFQIPKFKTFYHIDCYRIKRPKEVLVLGFKEIVVNPKNVVAVEWADRVKKILPKNAVWLKFKFIDKNARKITIKT